MRVQPSRAAFSSAGGCSPPPPAVYSRGPHKTRVTAVKLALRETNEHMLHFKSGAYNPVANFQEARNSTIFLAWQAILTGAP